MFSGETASPPPVMGPPQPAPTAIARPTASPSSSIAAASVANKRFGVGAGRRGNHPPIVDRTVGADDADRELGSADVDRDDRLRIDLNIGPGIRSGRLHAQGA